jgi:hypothetical protein
MSAQPDSTLLAVGDVIAEEKRLRLAADRELAANLERLRERIEHHAELVEANLMFALRDMVAATIAKLELKDGAPGAPGADAYPGQARGLHDPAASYRAMDVVAQNGCEWRAVRDDPGPLPGDGWTLGAKQGRKGDKGERGAQGLPGKDGTGIADMFIDGSVFVVVFTDGRRREFMIEAAA